MFDVGRLSDERLVGVLLDAEKRIATAQAEQLIAIAEITARTPAWMTAPRPDCPALHPIQVAAAEIGPALRISKRAAMDRVQTALDAIERLPRCVTALADGRLTLGKLRILLDHTGPLSPEATAAVEDAVLDRAGTDTPAAFAARVRRAVITADPDAARERVERAIRERRVDLFPDTDGMAVLRALLPAAEALRAYQLLTAAAKRAASDSDDRDIDARRADTLLDLLELLALDDSDSDDRTIDPAVPGPAADAQHTGEGGILADTDAADTDAAAAEPAQDADVEPVRATAPGRPRWGSRPVSLHVTVPWTTLAGLGDEPGDLGGYGPLTADVVRTLAADATWRRILTDPATGTVLDVGTTSYHPPAGLDAYVRARDKTCRFPGCRQPAHRADLDHTEPFPQGPTSDGNLAALCRPDHRIKTLTGWQVEQLGRARLRWTSPARQTYTTEPPPAHPPDPSVGDRDDGNAPSDARTGTHDDPSRPAPEDPPF